MKTLWAVLCFVAAAQAQSPAILWPADQFKLRDGFSPLDTMAMEDLQQLFQGKKIVIFHRRTLNIEDVAYPAKPLHYLQSVDAIAFQNVKNVKAMMSSMTGSDSVKVVALNEDQDLAEQDQLIKDTMQANPGFAAVLIGSGSGGHRLSRRAAKAQPPAAPAVIKLNDTNCLVYVEAIKTITTAGEIKVVEGKAACPVEDSVTITVQDNGTDVAELLMQKDGHGYNISVNGPYKLGVDTIWAPREFSYSCSDLRIYPTANNTNKNVYSLERLQMYVKPDNETRRFPQSFDCSTWFTPALWMGTSIVVFYLALLFISVLLLLDVKANDRFDDPKGKTITVNVSE